MLEGKFLKRIYAVTGFCLLAWLVVFVVYDLRHVAVERPSETTAKAPVAESVVAKEAKVKPASFRFYTGNFLFEGATVVVRDRNHRTARAQFPTTFLKDRWWNGADAPDLFLDTAGLDLSGEYNIIVHFKSGAISRYRFNSLPNETCASFYLHVCGPHETLFAAVYLNGINDERGHQFAVGIDPEKYK
jgi:hypothetical protein